MLPPNTLQNATEYCLGATEAKAPCAELLRNSYLPQHGIPRPLAPTRNSATGKSTMDVTIHEDKKVTDIEVSITCPRIDDRITRIVAGLNTFDMKFMGVIDGKTTILKPSDVFYFEAVDRKTFIYTQTEVFESPLKLYELKDTLTGTEFIQISKQMIINFDKVISIRPHFNARLQITLSNDEAAIVSRQYAPALKKKIGIR